MQSRATARDNLDQYHAQIHRDRTLGDAFDHFYPLKAKLKEPIQITFIDRFGGTEAGIDGGGVTKEFLMSVIKEAFAPTNADRLFTVNDKHLTFPNPTVLDRLRERLRLDAVSDEDSQTRQRDLLKLYEFVGRIIGKCLYEGILVDVNFAGFFLRKWASGGRLGLEHGQRAGLHDPRTNLNDLGELDEELYHGLVSVWTLFDAEARDLGSL